MKKTILLTVVQVVIFSYCNFSTAQTSQKEPKFSVLVLAEKGGHHTEFTKIKYGSINWKLLKLPFLLINLRNDAIQSENLYSYFHASPSFFDPCAICQGIDQPCWL